VVFLAAGERSGYHAGQMEPPAPPESRPEPPALPPDSPADSSAPSPTGGGDSTEGRFVHATVIVKPFRVEPVLHALEPFGLRTLAISEVRGYGRQKGHLELYQGREYAISFIPKVKIEFVLPAGEVDPMIQAVSRAARTGRIGDGKVFITFGTLVDLEES
jgi:nitrogen regulatory protein PII